MIGSNFRDLEIMDRSIFIFGYGSLMSAESASSALGRVIQEKDFIVSSLKGHKRNWSAVEHVYSETVGRNVEAVFLNVERCESCFLNGVLISVSQSELFQVDVREKNYFREDVTDFIRVDGRSYTEGEVYAYLAKPECRVDLSTNCGFFALERYVNMVRDACLRLSFSFWAEYQETTEICDFPVLGGEYLFLDPEQGKYV